jgi:hypothetical protein
MQLLISRPEPESIERAKPHLYRAIEHNTPEIVYEILDAGYPPSLPIIDCTSTSLLMVAVEWDRS